MSQPRLLMKDRRSIVPPLADAQERVPPDLPISHNIRAIMGAARGRCGRAGARPSRGVGGVATGFCNWLMRVRMLKVRP